MRARRIHIRLHTPSTGRVPEGCRRNAMPGARFGAPPHISTVDDSAESGKTTARISRPTRSRRRIGERRRVPYPGNTRRTSVRPWRGPDRHAPPPTWSGCVRGCGQSHGEAKHGRVSGSSASSKSPGPRSVAAADKQAVCAMPPARRARETRYATTFISTPLVPLFPRRCPPVRRDRRSRTARSD